MNAKKLLILAAVILLPLVARSAPAETVDRIVAVVNGEPITLFELRRRENPALLRMLSPKRFPPGGRELERAVLDDLIDRRLMLQKARDLRIDADESDIDAYIKGMFRSNGMDRKEFEAMLSEAGVALDDLRQGVAENIARSRLIHFEVRSRIVITEGEARGKYREEYGNPASRPGGYHLLQMGFRWNRPGSLSRTKEEARKRAAEARARVVAGEDFRELARRLSELPTADAGGDLGFLTAKEMAPWMLGALEGVKAGGLTRVVEGGGAMQFFLVFEVNTAERYEPPPFRLVKDELKNRLREAREKKYLDEWLTKIKKEAYIRIML